MDSNHLTAKLSTEQFYFEREFWHKLCSSDPSKIPINKIDPLNPELFEKNLIFPFFERLRQESPVHFVDSEVAGPYWSICTYKDIMEIDKNHLVFSSEPSIVSFDPEEDMPLKMFIAMDPPKHTIQRKTVEPAMAKENMSYYSDLIRKRTITVLDRLPINQPFDWVKHVSVELTTLMLVTLFDFPYQDKGKLTRWSDVATAIPGGGIVDSIEQRYEEMGECLNYFTTLWNQRVNSSPKSDLISMMAHSPHTRNMDPMEYLGNLVLLIVGGNDTTRNSMSGGVLALDMFPSEYEKLRANPGLIKSMVPEIIRWQTPLAYMRRTVKQDIVFRGKQMRQGDKVLMWYISGNRDSSIFHSPHDFIVDRKNARTHLSFGFGIHRCVGERIAELQLCILWEEIMKRFYSIEVVEEPIRVYSSFVRGYRKMMVKITSL